jgi:hypothetical protein
MEMMGESGICGLLQLSGDEFSFLFRHRKPERRCKGGACMVALPAPEFKVTEPGGKEDRTARSSVREAARAAAIRLRVPVAWQPQWRG